ncbi:MAG: hypothetical protein Q4D13_01850 [Erysipelotrichaceae bacterium]|nr:hypothetical protein [Erysipelotrichaceae bacterium]
MFVVCASCRAETPYYVKNYLNDLSTLSGIGNAEDLMGNLQSLREWEIIDEEDINHLDDKLDYLFLTSTISRFTGLDNSMSALVREGWISSKALPREKVSYETGLKVIQSAIEYRNNPVTDFTYETAYTDNVVSEDEASNVGDVYFSNEKGTYQKITQTDDGNIGTEDASFSDVFDNYDYSDTYEVDFSLAEVIPYEPDPEADIYVNHKYQLMAAKSQSFRKNGFSISYSLSSSGISFHISKNVNGINFFSDIDIYSVKPTIKWKYREGDIKNCFFDVKFNSTQKLGMSIGKYGNYYLQFKDLDSSSFMSLLKTMVQPHNDYVEASFPLAQVKTPIPNVPTAFLNLDLLVNLYVSGKVEVVLYNAHEMGFETSNGSLRTISSHSNKMDGDIGGSTKAALGVNFALEAVNTRLADIEVDGGLRTKLKSTLHLYNEDGKKTGEETSDIDYSILQEITKENNNVKVCGDISLSWLFDIRLNTPKTKLYSLGLGRTLNILDESDQIFGNLSHIENGMFVKKCTRSDKPSLSSQAIPVASNKIVLNSYAEVLNVNETFVIEVESLPEGYTIDDLRYSSSDNTIASVSGKTIKALKPGSCQIHVSSSDDKYTSYINILVSTG